MKVDRGPISLAMQHFTGRVGSLVGPSNSLSKKDQAHLKTLHDSFKELNQEQLQQLPPLVLAKLVEAHPQSPLIRQVSREALPLLCEGKGKEELPPSSLVGFLESQGGEGALTWKLKGKGFYSHEGLVHASQQLPAEEKKKVRKLDLSECYQITSLEEILVGFNKVTHLTLSTLHNLESLNGLKHLPHLQQLEAKRTENLSSLGGVEECANLSRLVLDGAWNLEDFSPLTELPLKHLDLTGASNLVPEWGGADAFLSVLEGKELDFVSNNIVEIYAEKELPCPHGHGV